MVLFVSLHQRKLPMEKIKIIVCCHKDDIKASSDVYLPLHVGKAISNKELNITCDNDGENISAKNLSYCELTGLYWAWKNLKDVDYIGLCHYRRYFDFHGIGRRLFPISTLPTEAFVSTDLSLIFSAGTSNNFEVNVEIIVLFASKIFAWFSRAFIILYGA